MLTRVKYGLYTLGFVCLVVVQGIVNLPKASALTITWDGEGSDNNWSTCANWLGDVCPGSGDVVVFDGTSTKDSVIDALAPGTIAEIYLETGYTGTVTQAREIVTQTLLIRNGSGHFSSADQAFTADDITIQGGGYIASSTTTTSRCGFTHQAGTFDANGGTFVIDNNWNGCGVYSSNTFHNLTITGCACLVRFELGTTQTIEGAFVVSGPSKNSRITLASTTGGQEWFIDPQGTRDVEFVSVQDSHNIHNSAIIANSSLNSGHNTNWDFPLPPPPNSYGASDVLGADDFNSSGDFGGDGLNPELDLVHHRLFVSDPYGGYIWVYNLDENNNLIDKEYDNILYGDDYYIGGIKYDSVQDRLFAADLYENCRVLVFDTTTIDDYESAAYVLGGDDVGSDGTCALTDHNFGGGDYYGDVAYDSTMQYLFVTDEGNDRIMIFDLSGGITNNMAASYVLGAPDFDTNASGTASINTFGGLEYANLAIDPIRHYLFVTNYGDYRTVVYDTSDISNGMGASYVLGAPDFDSEGNGGSAANEMGPVGVEYDTNQQILYVADYRSSRIMLFGLSLGISDNMDAIAVIGQPDFETSGSGTSQVEMYPYDQANMSYDFANRRLYLGDDYNSRVLIYDFVKITKDELSNGTAGVVYSQTITTQNSQGTKNFIVSSGSLPPGLSLDSSTGVLSGTPTTTGTYSFTIKVTDTPGSFGSFKDTKSYVLGISVATSSSISSSSGGTSSDGSETTATDEEMAVTDSETTPSKTNTKPVSAPKTEDNGPTSVVWWGMGGISLFVIFGWFALFVLKRTD